MLIAQFRDNNDTYNVRASISEVSKLIVFKVYRIDPIYKAGEVHEATHSTLFHVLESFKDDELLDYRTAQ